MNPTRSQFGNDLGVVDAGANVVFDMFLDPEATISTSTTLPKYEVMVWIGAFGDKKPIGFNSSIQNPPTQNLGSTQL